MNLKTRATPKTVTGAAKEGASALGDASQQARDVVRDARTQARRQVVRARIAAAKARAGGRAKASGISSKAVGAAGAAGLVAGYFLDPDTGKRRRNTARDRTLALIRRGTRKTRREAGYVAGTVGGAKSRTAPEKPAANDQALAERVKSEIFQPADAPKGPVNVNVERGIVYLRGEVKRPDQIRELIEQAGSVDGVAGVESLLHTP
jgi:osmotically-inducible protein OsmY